MQYHHVLYAGVVQGVVLEKRLHSSQRRRCCAKCLGLPLFVQHRRTHHLPSNKSSHPSNKPLRCFTTDNDIYKYTVLTSSSARAHLHSQTWPFVVHSQFWPDPPHPHCNVTINSTRYPPGTNRYLFVVRLVFTTNTTALVLSTGASRPSRTTSPLQKRSVAD